MPLCTGSLSLGCKAVPSHARTLTSRERTQTSPQGTRRCLARLLAASANRMTRPVSPVTPRWRLQRTTAPAPTSLPSVRIAWEIISYSPPVACPHRSPRDGLGRTKNHLYRAVGLQCSLVHNMQCLLPPRHQVPRTFSPTRRTRQRRRLSGRSGRSRGRAAPSRPLRRQRLLRQQLWMGLVKVRSRWLITTTA